MEKKNKKEFYKVAISALLASSVLLFTLLILHTNGVLIQIGKPSNGISHQVLSNSLLIVATVSLVYIVNDRVIKGVFIAVGALLILVPTIPSLLTDTEYVEFSSPDNNEEFVVMERGYGTLYQLSDSGLYMTYLTDFDTDDGYKPFSEGAYELEWREPDQLIIRYKFDYMSGSLDKEVSIDY
ncbi:hypothetical protein [Halobacillus salinus]|uniref:hypothetical protein n=1 Tax=Halobacillus salinus TaxID=192814 RepID=UPI0009A70ABB|nr:hypothetical protein [Halobacillus salinus]